MKVDLSTSYMGLKLKNPLIASSSGLTGSTEDIKKLHKSGIGAIVLKSLFEEQILREIDSLEMNNMYGSFRESEDYVAFYTREHNLHNYINLLREAKANVDVPVIASVSCITLNGWTDFVKKLEEAGADAVELNMFILPSDPSRTGDDIEKAYFDVVNTVRQQVKIPLALKVSSYFSGMAHTMVRLSQTGISSLVLFNRFFTPDIDIETGKVVPGSSFSTPEEMGNTLRWLSILSGKVSCDLAATTGIHSGDALIKCILAGANAVQVASVLYQRGVECIPIILRELETWMISNNYSCVSEMTGKLNSKNIQHPMLYERAQFMKYFTNKY